MAERPASETAQRASDETSSVLTPILAVVLCVVGTPLIAAFSPVPTAVWGVAYVSVVAYAYGEGMFSWT